MPAVNPAYSYNSQVMPMNISGSTYPYMYIPSTAASYQPQYNYMYPPQQYDEYQYTMMNNNGNYPYNPGYDDMNMMGQNPEIEVTEYLQEQSLPTIIQPTPFIPGNLT